MSVLVKTFIRFFIITLPKSFHYCCIIWPHCKHFHLYCPPGPHWGSFMLFICKKIKIKLSSLPQKHQVLSDLGEGSATFSDITMGCVELKSGGSKQTKLNFSHFWGVCRQAGDISPCIKWLFPNATQYCIYNCGWHVTLLEVKPSMLKAAGRQSWYCTC